MNWRLLAALPLVLAVGCTVDSDGDGLSNKEEKALGLDPESADSDGDGVSDYDEVNGNSDPLVADTDGDGLTDGEEAEAGSDPTVVDTDGDGYTDRDEVFEGHDPADDRDVIYKGGWPYYFEKDDITGGGFANPIDVGKRIGNLSAKDQFGDVVDLFDFYAAGKPVILDVSAQWCPPCQDMASWMDNDPLVAPAYDEYWPGVREAVEAGDILWVTVLSEDYSGNPATKPTVTEWYNDFPSSHIPVLADTDYVMPEHVNLRGWPTVILLDPELKVEYEPPASEGYWMTLDYVVDNHL
jgi:thiol-disulfide isomerase/thioredoxin